jgi:hypothetical protein
MRRTGWRRIGRPAGLALALTAVLATYATAVAASGCEECYSPRFSLWNDSWCRAVPPDGTVGVTDCQTSRDLFNGHMYCVESGNACSVIDAGGGGSGSGGGGGGGGSCTNDGSGCPAECFSCRGAM